MKYPLSQQGVQDKLAVLYQLNDTQLRLQAASIAFDFRSFIKNNFQLNEEQLLYLTGMDNIVVNYFGQQCAMAMYHRLPITFYYPNEVQGGKWTELQSSLHIAADGIGNISASGNLIFTIMPM